MHKVVGSMSDIALSLFRRDDEVDRLMLCGDAAPKGNCTLRL